MRGLSRSLQLVFALSFVIAGCEGGNSLLVDLRTDLVAGEEFQAIRTEVTRGTTPVGTDEVSAPFATDYVAGSRVFETEGLEAGDYRVTVRLLDRDGRVVAQRRTALSLSSDVAFTTVIKRDSRSCDPEMCTAMETCGLEGCTDERCSPETGAEFCPPPECMSETDCEMRESCSEAVCLFGRCLYGSAVGACGAAEWCDPDMGCRPRTGAPDDGGTDGGMDGGGDSGGGCTAGTADCDGDPANGCEQDIANDPRNCGTCGLRCDGAGGSTPTCSAGVCGLECPVGSGDCDSDPSNGCETDVTNDPANCALCGSACPGGLPICIDADCIPDPFPSDGAEGPFAPTKDVLLSAGVHQFTTIDIPAGVTVTTDGTGVLELYAEGDVVIEGVIDLAGGNGGLATGGGAFDQGGGGGTGTLVDGDDGLVDVCRAGGGGGLGANGDDAPGAGTVCGAGGRRGGGAGGGNGGGGGGGGAAGGAGGWGGAILGGDGASLPGSSGGVSTTDGVGSGAETGLPMYGGSDGVRACCDGMGGGGGGSIGMEAVMDLAMSTTFRPGSGGGGGGGRNWSANRASGSGGGGGGGALRIASPTSIRIGAGAQLLVVGGAGGGQGGVRGLGGGGSGGAVYLAAPSLTLLGEVDTSGGQGGTGRDGGTGGDGGMGRIRISSLPASCSVMGSLTPPLMTACEPTDVAGFAYVGTYPD